MTTQDSRVTKSSRGHKTGKYEESSQPEYYAEEYEEDQTHLNEISTLKFAKGIKTESVGSPCNVVMVAEKPSIALSIAEALSRGGFTKKIGAARSIPIYVYNGTFKGRSAHFKVTSVAGHVYNRDFPLNFQDRRTDPVVLFDAPTIRNVDK